MSPIRLATLVLAIAASAPSMANQSAATSWTRLTELVGTWRLVDSKTPPEQAFRIIYRLISASSAMVESFGDPSRQVTETIYHLDGQRLLATHYCAQGNQPRLQLQIPSSNDSLDFRFLDATNLRSHADSHLIRMTFKLVDSRHMIRHEVYLKGGKESESTISLEKMN